MKKLVEETARLTSMKHVIIFDVKGDFVQLLQPSDRKDGEADSFEALCDVRVYTFGTGYGFPATLNPFVDLIVDATNFIKATQKWKSPDAKFAFSEKVRLLVKDAFTAVGLIKVDFSTGGEILANSGLPALIKMSLTGAGESQEAHKALAADLMSAGCQTCVKYFYKKEKLPDTFDAFADAIADAIGKASANGAIGNASELISLPANLSQDDLTFVANQIRAEVNGPWSTIYAPVYGDEGNKPPPPTSDTGDFHAYPLVAATLCDDGDKRRGRPVKISVIALFNLGDDLMKQRVVQTCLERIDRWVPGSGGSQDAPRTAVVIDEAHLAMPDQGGSFGAGKGAGASAVVRRLLKLKRSNGIITILGTQCAQLTTPAHSPC
eukprot:1724826-Prymnesium_polylepis.1